MIGLILLFIIPFVNGDRVVLTSSGPVSGISLNTKNVEAFLGIPYADSPVGRLRFTKPVPKSPCNETFKANELPPACVQIPSKIFNQSIKMDEDCLYLNIWVPKSESSQKAVMVFIHGDGFMTGSSNLNTFDGAALSQYADVIVASLNYRVGTLGLFSGYFDKAAGNISIYDQLVALQWIKDNAEHFGGNPDNIMIFGEGAETFSASMPMIYPLSKNFFKRVILQNGSDINPMYSDDNEILRTPEVKQYTSGNIIAGVGYSGDTQQIAPQVCYNATLSSTSGQQAYIQLHTAISFSELENKLGISVSVNGKYEMFSADAKASYVRSIQDKDYSMSLNYYEYATNKVAVQLAGYGDRALTESGKDFYKGGKNPYFGLLCGDHYITSYQQGALLIMGLNIKFSSSNAKRKFDEKVGASFGDIVSASESIKDIVTKNKISGSIIIQAFQTGGEPSRLSEILNKDSTGQYYVLTCSLTAMDNCIKAASGLLDYAKNDFSQQFSFTNNTGLTPLGIAFSQYNPIEYVGLIPPVSLVTQEVAQYRNELSSKLKENEYYQQKFYPFFNKGYPVNLHDNFIKNANAILSKANSNVQILMQVHKGAADCFNFPDRCKSIKASIDSQLQNITISELKFLDNIKYTITTVGGLLYNTGLNPETSWDGIPNESGSVFLTKVYSASVTEKQYSYDTDFSNPPDVSRLGLQYTGNSIDSGMRYIGALYWCPRKVSSGQCAWERKIVTNDYPEGKLISPFFFQAYNISEWRNPVIEREQMNK